MSFLDKKSSCDPVLEESKKNDQPNKKDVIGVIYIEIRDKLYNLSKMLSNYTCNINLYDKDQELFV